MINAQQILDDPIQHYPAATVACFDPTTGELPRRRLDEPRTIDFLERLAAAGAPAVLIGASTGHGHLRTADELARWMECAAEASLGETVRVALLRPEDSEADNGRLVDLAARLNYPVVFVRPGRGLVDSANAEEVAEQVAENMKPLVARIAAAGLAVGIYSIPDVSGVPLSPEAAAMLVQGTGGDRIVAVKVTEANYETSTLRFLQHPGLRHLKIVQGWDPHLARALQDGPRHDAKGRQRCGVTSGPMSFAVHQYDHLLDAARRNDWAEVARAQAAVDLLFTSMQDDPRKFADLQRAKFLMGLGQPLLGAVTEDQWERVLTALRSIPRPEDRERLAKSLDLMGNGPFHATFTSGSAR